MYNVQLSKTVPFSAQPATIVCEQLLPVINTFHQVRPITNGWYPIACAVVPLV